MMCHSIDISPSKRGKVSAAEETGFLNQEHKRRMRISEANRFKIRDTDFRTHRRAMRRKSGRPHAVTIQDLFHLEWIVVHRERMKISGFTQKFATLVYHGLNPVVAQLCRPRHAFFKWFVFGAKEFQFTPISISIRPPLKYSINICAFPSAALLIT